MTIFVNSVWKKIIKCNLEQAAHSVAFFVFIFEMSSYYKTKAGLQVAM